MTKDLTSGNIWNRIITFTVPVLLGNLFQQLYSMVDSIIVGRFVGKDALAAVGATGSINFMILGFIVGLCGGVCVPVAKEFGAGRMDEMRKMSVIAILVCTTIGIITTIGTYLGTDAMLHSMKTPDNIIKDAYRYISIIFLGIPATLLYNVPANISRAIGDSKTPLYFLLLSAGLNTVLDLAFVCLFHMGVPGTAIATVISQLVSGVLCIMYLRRKYEILHFHKEDWHVKWSKVRTSTVMGMSMGLQFSITAIGSVVLQSAVNTLGSDTVAVVNVAMKIQLFITQPLEALGVTMATFCGQNSGARRQDRIYSGIKKAFVLMIGCSVFAFLIVLVGVGPLSELFMKKAEMTGYIRSSIRQLLFVNSCFYVLLGSLLILRYALQGLGHSVVAMGAGVFEMVGRCLVAFIAVSSLGFSAVCFANPVAWFGANVLLVPVFIWVMKKKSRENATMKSV